MSWFASYLHNRCQTTKVNYEISNKERVEYGVPQGSVLRPLLFTIFINDLPDTALSISSTSTNDLEIKLNRELAKVTGWMHKNQLTLNAGKTKTVKFGTAQTLNKVGELKLGMGGTDIEVAETFKYIGAMLDSRLTFSQHVRYIRRKCVGRIRMLSKLRLKVGQEMSLELN